MTGVVGVFDTPERARDAIVRLQQSGVPNARLSILAPGTGPRESAARVPTDEGESQGMGAAVGSVLGGALGLSGAAIVLPGVGPIVAAGMLAAGIAGAAGGAVVGDKVEDHLSGGLPRDELEVYQAFLRRGRSVVVASVDTDEEAERVRNLLRGSGAESVDPAREDWRTGIANAER